MISNYRKGPDAMPDTIPANGQDWANHTARYFSCNAQINAVLEFDRKLDIDCMKNAVRMSVDAEPVLGCMFVEDPDQAYWKRLEDVNAIEWCSLEETDNIIDAQMRITSESFEPELHQLKAKIIRSLKKDILCIKLNHACTDGGGVKEYIHLLADIYTRLSEDKSYVPEVNTNSREFTMSIFKSLGIPDPRMAYNPQIAALRPTWAFPFYEGKPYKLNNEIRRLGKDCLDNILSYARQRKATMNDMILTAFYRAMFDIVQQETAEPMELYVSVDLRRYLPDNRTGVICNLSGALNARLERIEGESFENTLNRVSVMMNGLKENKPGIHSAASMELLRGISYRDASAALRKIGQRQADSGKSSPMLSNMGVLAQYPLKFGDITVQDAYIITPGMFSPGFMLGAGTYNGVLTFCVSYYEPTTHTEDVVKFIDLVEGALRKIIM